VINEPTAAALAYGMDKSEDKMWVEKLKIQVMPVHSNFTLEIVAPYTTEWICTKYSSFH